MVAVYVPELAPVTDRQALLMTRPWLDWCRRVTLDLKQIGGQIAANFRYRFSTGTTAPPNAQQLQLNSGHPYTGVTAVYASYEVEGGGDAKNYLLRIPVDAKLFIQQESDHASYAELKVLAVPIDHGTYAEITVEGISTGNAISNDQPVSMAVITSGGGGAGGDVVGPSSSTNDAIALYNGTTGKILKDSLKTIPALTTDITNSILPGGKLPDANLSNNVQMKPTWQDVAFNAGNFSTNGGTWTVSAGQVLINHYRRVGTSLLWVIIISAAGPATAGTQLQLSPPVVGVKNGDGAVRPGVCNDDSGRPDVWASVSGSYIVIKKSNGLQFSGVIDLHLAIEYEVS